MKLSILIVSLLFGLCSFAETVISNDEQAQGASTLKVEEPKSAAVKEAEIPVQLEPTKKASSESFLIFKALASLAVIGILGIGAYIFIGKYRRTQLGKSSAPEIKVLRQHYLGPKKSLAIVRVAGESVLIGITEQNINMIKSLALLDEDIPEETPQNFQSVFNGVDKSADHPSSQTSTLVKSSQEKNDDQDEYSISGIRDFVSTRLKNMRSLD
jgi:flagellar protein FliO/FliZ